MNVIITGVAGFIGSHLSEELLSRGYCVTGIDNFTTGRREFLKKSVKNNKFKIIEMDILDLPNLKNAFQNHEIVFHLAANADVRYGTNHPRKDLEQNTIGTFNVLEAMRHNNIKKIIFSSTGSVYGDASVIPTQEDSFFPIQTSLYGASKVASEGLITAYCEGYNFQSWIFRFVSILGERYTHGHIFDFVKSLKINPNTLKILGDGQQKKSYLYVLDCINAIMIAINKSSEKINIFNLGTNEYCKVVDSASWIISRLKMNPSIMYTGGNRGWTGDNPFIWLDTSKIRTLGWSENLTIQQGVFKTVDYLTASSHLFDTEIN